MNWHPLLILLCAGLFGAAQIATPASAVAARQGGVSGCGKAMPGGEMMVPVTSGGRLRPVLVHVPKGYSAAKPAPLVFLLHGSGGNGRKILDTSKLAETADKHGFIVVAPDAGIAIPGGLAWNIPGVPLASGAMPSADAADDVRYIGDVIDAVSATMCVDQARIYSTGYSGGGRMSSWLGCVLPGRIAAIAPVVGLRAGNPDASDPSRPDPATCNPKRAMPVIAFAGGADTSNPIAGGGAAYWRYGLDAAATRWAKIDGCGAPVRTAIDADHYEDRYPGCQGKADLVVRVQASGSHVWSVADNEQLWAFFAAHPLR
jgi:polyhydroxybutyrate depolymerase